MADVRFKTALTVHTLEEWTADTFNVEQGRRWNNCRVPLLLSQWDLVKQDIEYRLAPQKRDLIERVLDSDGTTKNVQIPPWRTDVTEMTFPIRCQCAASDDDVSDDGDHVVLIGDDDDDDDDDGDGGDNDD